MAQLNFNANQVEGDVKDFSLLPKGKYQAVIIKTDMERPNERGTQQLHVTWEVISGPHVKRQVSNWITVVCPSSVEAQDIGMRQLKNICESVGLASFSDTDELCGRQHIIDVGEKKDNRDASKVYNEVKRCYPADGPQGTNRGTPSATTTHGAQATTVPSSTPTAAAATTQKAGPAANRPPWMR